MEFFRGKRERSVLNWGVQILNGIAQFKSFDFLQIED